MKKGIKRVLFLVLIFSLSIKCTSLAEVLTTPKTEGHGDMVYVAGDEGLYPLEYYDSKEDKYVGVIPQMLEKISQKTGIDFVYINGDKTNKEAMGENMQVEIVSASENGLDKEYYKDFVELFAYEKDGERKEVGFIFTQRADEDLVERIKRAAEEISAEEKNALILENVSKKDGIDYRWVILSALLCLALIAVIVVLKMKITRIKRDNDYDKMTDRATGMGNLDYFKHHFLNTITDNARTLYYVAYLSLDSGYLRTYYGEASFENVVKYTALTLSEKASDRDFAARISEDGFAMAFQAKNENDAVKKAEELIRKLNRFEDAKEFNNKVVFRLALYNLIVSDKNCEIILFNLKKNCNRIFNTEKQVILCNSQSMHSVQEEKKITEGIMEAFENNEFKMYLQFVVDNKNKKVVSAEALSRWDSPTKGLITPGKYIENMEIAGLISKHDFNMFEMVCRQLEKWKDTVYKNIIISCNFTRITLSEEHFINHLEMIANSYSFNRGNLAIEITEDAMEKDRKTATENVRRCKELGFKIYLDDLGSGYTSLANLCDYPIDVVKIDREILERTDTSRGRELFDGIIKLAHSLNIKVICEGVETDKQNEFVSDSDCDYIQGWHYSKAFPEQEFENFIKTRI